MNLISIILVTLFTDVESSCDVNPSVMKPARVTSSSPRQPMPAANVKPSKPLHSAMKKRPNDPTLNPNDPSQIVVAKGPNPKAEVRFDEATLIIHKNPEDSRTYTLNWENTLPKIRAYTMQMVMYEKPEAQPVVITEVPAYHKESWTVTFEKFGIYVITVKALDRQGNVIQWGRETIEIEFRVLSNQLVVRKGSLIEFYWEKPPIDVEYQIQLGHYKSKKGEGTFVMGLNDWKMENYRYTAREEGTYEIIVSFTYNGAIMSDMNSVYVTNMKPTMKFQTNDNQGRTINLENHGFMWVMEENYIYWKRAKKAKKYFVQVLLYGRHAKYGFVVGSGPNPEFLYFPFNMKELGDYTIFVVALTDRGRLVAWGRVSFSLVNSK